MADSVKQYQIDSLIERLDALAERLSVIEHKFEVQIADVRELCARMRAAERDIAHLEDAARTDNP